MSPRRVRKAVAGFAAGLIGSIATIAAVNEIGGDRGAGEQAEVVLGRIDFDGFCADHDGSAVLLTQDALGWRCVEVSNEVFVTREIDPNSVCAWQYDSNAKAILTASDDPQGWRCFGPP